jgi:hypothetical protein
MAAAARKKLGHETFMLGIIWTEWMIILRPNEDYNIEYMRETLDYNITLIPLTGDT